MFKKTWAKVLLGIAIVVILAGAGFAVYRFGYTQGALSVRDGIEARLVERFGENFEDLENLPLKVRPGIRSMLLGRGFGSGNQSFGKLGGFSPFSAIFRLAVFIVVGWLAYKLIAALFHNNGWQLTFSRTAEDEEVIE